MSDLLPAHEMFRSGSRGLLRAVASVWQGEDTPTGDAR